MKGLTMEEMAAQGKAAMDDYGARYGCADPNACAEKVLWGILAYYEHNGWAPFDLTFHRVSASFAKWSAEQR